jgi:hypothetical protein
MSLLILRNQTNNTVVDPKQVDSFGEEKESECCEHRPRLRSTLDEGLESTHRNLDCSILIISSTTPPLPRPCSRPKYLECWSSFHPASYSLQAHDIIVIGAPTTFATTSKRSTLPCALGGRLHHGARLRRC